MAELKIGKYLVTVFLFQTCRSVDENCDYLDTSRKDRTNQLQCENFGCCGDFKNRHCCVGPIPIIAGVFGSILFILIVAVIIGICYAHQKKKQRILPVPTITAEMYNDIPLPSPPCHTPLVYNPARLHPPSPVVHPFRHGKAEDSIPNHPPPSNFHPPRLKAFRSK